MAKKIAVCKKCGKQYPRWRLEREGVCEAVVSAKNGLKRCCGSIIESSELPKEAPKEKLRPASFLGESG